MRVGGGDAERLRLSRPPPHPPQCAHWGTFPPGGEGFGATQIGRDSALCGTFGYIYWELGRSAPVGRRTAQCAAPTAKTWQAQAARPGGRALQKGRRGQAPALCRCNPLTSLGFCLSSAPFWWAGEETRSCGGVWAKNAGAQCAPLHRNYKRSAYKKRDRSGTYPLKPRGETQFRTKFLCLLSF